MPDATSAGLVVAVIVSIGTFIKFWTTFSDRITENKSLAEAAMKESTEAKEENRKLRGIYDALILELHDQFDRSRREVGESNAAIRQHITEQAFFVRDSFARKDELASALKDIKDVQSRMDDKLDGIANQIRDGGIKGD
jgi:hypothetical protein